MLPAALDHACKRPGAMTVKTALCPPFDPRLSHQGVRAAARPGNELYWIIVTVIETKLKLLVVISWDQLLFGGDTGVFTRLHICPSSSDC